MGVVATAILKKETLRIARCLVGEGMPPGKIESSTGCSIEGLFPSNTYH